MSSHKEKIFISLSNLYIESIDEDGVPNPALKRDISEIFGLLLHCPEDNNSNFDVRWNINPNI